MTQCVTFAYNCRWFTATFRPHCASRLHYLGPCSVCCCPWCWSIIRLKGEVVSPVVSLLCKLSQDSYIYYLLFKVKDFQKPVAEEIESGLSLPNVCRWFLYFGQFHLKFSFWKLGEVWGSTRCAPCLFMSVTAFERDADIRVGEGVCSLVSMKPGWSHSLSLARCWVEPVHLVVCARGLWVITSSICITPTACESPRLVQKCVHSLSSHPTTVALSRPSALKHSHSFWGSRLHIIPAFEPPHKSGGSPLWHYSSVRPNLLPWLLANDQVWSFLYAFVYAVAPAFITSTLLFSKFLILLHPAQRALFPGDFIDLCMLGPHTGPHFTARNNAPPPSFSVLLSQFWGRIMTVLSFYPLHTKSNKWWVLNINLLETRLASRFCLSYQLNLPLRSISSICI